jgi:hypothetical protein
VRLRRLTAWCRLPSASGNRSDRQPDRRAQPDRPAPTGPGKRPSALDKKSRSNAGRIVMSSQISRNPDNALL